MAKQKKTQKRNDPARFAVLGLWISGIGAVATLILLIVKLLVTAKIYTLPDTHIFNWSLGISAGLIIIGLALYALLNPRQVRLLLTGRQARYGSNAAIMVVAFIGILVVVNFFVYQNPGKPLDFTEDKQNSLSPETLDTLKALPTPILATAFYTTQISSDAAQKLLENYKNLSNGKFDFSFVDPDQNPLAARQAGITGDGKIYLQMGEQHEIVASASEQEITSAMIRLMNPGERMIYFLTGHGERDILTSSDSAYTDAKAALEAKNYTVQSLNLIAENKIPENISVIVIAGPTQPITTAEKSLLETYVSNGGALIVLEEPAPLTQYDSANDLLASYLSAQWGIQSDLDIVIDTNSTQPLYAVAASYGNQPITQKLQGMVSFFPVARSLSFSSDLTNQPTALVKTIASSWGETDFASMQANGQVAYDPGVDIPGPLTLAASVEDTSTDSHVVVFGDSDFASNLFFSQYANGDLFLNAIDWAAGQEQLINLNSPTAITRTLVLPSSFWLLVIAISFLCLLPGLVILVGVTSWLRRRSKG
jgi:ABC-type uncharacterized transport system involved in gliding motility auxiliary subunit